MTARRIQKSATIDIDGPVDQMFPLFGPIREKEWASGWDPKVIFPTEALVEKQMVFQTFGDETFTWVIVNYDPARFMIEYMVSATERIWFITVQCVSSGQRTLATITYTYTGFTPIANQKNEQAITQMCSSNLKDWETEINDYLKTKS